MFDLIRTYQLDIMLALSTACFTFGLLLFVTRFIEKKRKALLICMEFAATFLLFFDRLAYIYSGNTEPIGYVMVRLSNFLVFFLTAGIVLIFDFYLMYLLDVGNVAEKASRRLLFVAFASVAEMIMVVISQFTGFYYYFDEMNVYHRGPGFLFCYIIPVICPLIQFAVILQYKKAFRPLIYISLLLYIFIPIAMGVIQIFAYGISIVNMAMVLVSVSLYVFTYLDINEEVLRAHEIEREGFKTQQKSMRTLFDQTATAFISAIEKRDVFAEGHAKRVAKYAKRVAQKAGKSEEECEEAYYAGLLHDVGTVGLPDSILEKTEMLSKEEYEVLKKRPVIGGEVLSRIREYPYLKEGALYSHERYDGSGYPKGLKGEAIPEIARIVAVADAYDAMMSRQRFRNALPYLTVREEFIKRAGKHFDPKYAELMVQIMDADNAQKQEESTELKKELECGVYRSAVSGGISIESEVTKIRFVCSPIDKKPEEFSAPSIIMFDSFDRHVHSDPKAIEAYHYLEYGELWFDGHYVSTGARDMEVSVTTKANDGKEKDADVYEIEASRFDDHVSVKLMGPSTLVDVIMALPDKSKYSFIGLTGENCRLSKITIQNTGKTVGEGDIRRIVSEESYIDRLESDVPNIQIDRVRSAATEGILLEDELQIDFHTMTLPSGSLVWHCPYIVLYSSEDKRVGGKGYQEYALIKINGESTGDENCAKNILSMKKNEDFQGWEVWKATNKVGMECSVRFAKKGEKLLVSTENLGISIENTTIVFDATKDVYVSLTGDQVALTDIRVKKL